MDYGETPTHSFVVKVWLEEPADRGHCGVWRGHITHVASGKRVYLAELGAIRAFVAPYLAEMGVRFGVRCSIQRWLGRLGGSRLRG
jgi:hypothetical protein